MNATFNKPLVIPRLDARKGKSIEILSQLRRKLSPQGDVISPRGKQLTEQVFGQALSPIEVVQRICDGVRQRGIEAVLQYTEQFDYTALTAEELRVPIADMEAAHATADPAFLETIRRIRNNIVEFQTAIRHQDVEITPRKGVRLGQRYLPLHRVGCCVPGGVAAYPSTVLMTVVPAQVAGVQEIVVVAPPTAFGANNPVILATCWELGVREVYRMGGAQAVAALAYGCESVPAVDKIVGPGNLFVALAKKFVFGTGDIDSIAGPSEVIVLADKTANPSWVAADLLSQAEHSPGSAILISWDEALIDAVEQELQSQVAMLERCDLTIDALAAFGALILVDDANHACALTDSFAPEHLHIQTDKPRKLLEKIRNAGAAFLGHHTPVALGDYAAGPSHVLPTGGTARWAAGLSVNDFLRSGSVIEFDEKGLEAIADDVQLMAGLEGLTAHGRSILTRRS